LVRRAIYKFHFLEKNSHVLVAVSGGVDSLVLLFLLVEYNKRFRQNWEITTCHINPQFPDWDVKTIEDIFIKLNIPYHIIKTNINKNILNLEKKCFACAHERRRKILELADSLNIFQVALAHHQQDVDETLLLNMIYNGEISTLIPKQSLIHGRFFFIRPLYFLDKEIIQKIAQVYNLPKHRNICPYSRESKRDMIRNFLEGIRKENPDVYKNIFNSLFNIKELYLPY